MKSIPYILLLSTLFITKTLCTIDIAQAPLAMDLTAELEDRILRETKRELRCKLFFYRKQARN